MTKRRRNGAVASVDSRPRPQITLPRGQGEKIVRWTRWQGISAIIGAVITFGGAAFYLVDRFGEPGDAALPPPPSISVEDSRSTPHPVCDSGSICLWPEPGFGGEFWEWSPISDRGRPIPGYLRDHVGSFDAQTDACFVDTETGSRRSADTQDWSGKYLDDGKFGRLMDTIKASC